MGTEKERCCNYGCRCPENSATGRPEDKEAQPAPTSLRMQAALSGAMLTGSANKSMVSSTAAMEAEAERR
eukprot:8637329-Prorocentrum_lima.AAC.1